MTAGIIIIISYAFVAILSAITIDLIEERKKETRRITNTQARVKAKH